MIEKISYCMGTKTNCWSEISKGAKLCKFGKEIDKNIECLVLNPTISEIIKTNSLEFIPKETKYLKIPLPLIEYLSREKALNSLETLLIYNKEEYIGQEYNKVSFFEQTAFKESLKSLVFTGDCSKAGEYWSKLNFDLSQFESLEYLSSLLDKENVIIQRISKMNNLKHLDIYGIETEEVFPFIKNMKFKSLSISHISPSIDLKLITPNQSLEVLQIHNMKSILDCTIFEEFPNIIELSLSKIKKIINVEVLLHIPTLQNLTIANSSNPIKKNVKDKFIASNLNYLDIDYA